MADMGWTTYISQIENDADATCKAIREKLNLPVDLDLDSIECEFEECRKECPFYKGE